MIFMLDPGAPGVACRSGCGGSWGTQNIHWDLDGAQKTPGTACFPTCVPSQVLFCAEGRRSIHNKSLLMTHHENCTRPPVVNGHSLTSLWCYYQKHHVNASGGSGIATFFQAGGWHWSTKVYPRMSQLARSLDGFAVPKLMCPKSSEWP